MSIKASATTTRYYYAAFITACLISAALVATLLKLPSSLPSEDERHSTTQSIANELITAQTQRGPALLTSPHAQGTPTKRLQLLLQQASLLTWDIQSATAIGEAQRALQAMVPFEKAAADHMRNNKPQLAFSVLRNTAYIKHAEAYNHHIQTFLALLRTHSKAKQAALSETLSTNKLASLILFPMLIATIGIMYQLCNRKKDHLMNSHQNLQSAHAMLENTLKECGDDLTRSRAAFDAIFKHMPSGVAIYTPLENDNDFIVDALNPAGAGIDKLDAIHVRGQRLSVVQPDAQQTGLIDVMLKVYRTGKAMHYPVTIYSEGDITGWRENYIARLTNNKILCIYDDATRRKRAETQLVRSEGRFKAIFHSVDDAILLVGKGGSIEQVNETALFMCRTTKDEAISLAFPHDLAGNDQALDSLTKAMDKALAGNRTTVEAKIKRVGDASFFDASISMTAMDFSDYSLLVTIRDITQFKVAADRFKRTERRFRDVALLSANWIWEVDEKGNYTYASPQIEDITGYTPEELKSMTPFDLMPENERDRIQVIFQQLAAQKSPIFDLENAFVTKDGRQGMFLTNGIPLLDEHGELTGYFGVDKDITKQKEDEQNLKLFQKVFTNALEGITITNAHGDIVAVNPAFTTITGYTAEEVIGQNPRLFKSDRHPQEFYQQMWDSITTTGLWSGEIWNRRKNGEAFPEWLSISAIKDSLDNTTHYVAVFHDITEMKRQERQLAHQEYHDPLTDLPNRLLLLDRLQMAFAHAQRVDKKVGMLFIDLDNFKTINDSLGHHVGDRLIQSVATRLENLLRDEDTVARLGGDEFVIMVQEIEEAHETILLAERIIADFTAPYSVKGHELYVTPSIGITLFPDDSKSPEGMIRNADTAMYQAKKVGKNTYQMFSSNMNRDVMRRLTLESNMRKALLANEFTIYLQPRIAMPSEKARGMEALVRWLQPDGTMVNPGEFIPMAEETGLIVPLGEQVLEMACRYTQELISNGHPDLSVSVNLSPRQFQQDDLIPTVERTLRETGLPPANLELEITETTLATDMSTAITKLTKLSEMGIRLAIDDFGTGYSSLYYLRQMPIDILKIDRSFISDVPEDKDAESIVEAILLMAEKLGLTVVAEGAETQEQVDFLKARGCQEIQGFFYSKPLPLKDFTKYVETEGK